MDLFHESLQNIRFFCEKIQSENLFDIIINGEKISLPIEVAASISKLVTQMLLNDATSHQMEIKIELRDNSSLNHIVGILTDPKYEVPKDINYIDLLEFALAIQNPFLLYLIIKQKVDKSIDSMNISEILEQLIINYKISFSPFFQMLKDLTPNISYEEEVNFIASNFYQFIHQQEFIEWCKKIENIDILKLILDSESLIIEDEDSLLGFIISLYTAHPDFIQLLQYIDLEYCSTKTIESLVSLVDSKNNIFKTQNQLSLFKCLSQRCITVTSNLAESKHKRAKKIDDSDNNGSTVNNDEDNSNNQIETDNEIQPSFPRNRIRLVDFDDKYASKDHKHLKYDEMCSIYTIGREGSNITAEIVAVGGMTLNGTKVSIQGHKHTIADITNIRSELLDLFYPIGSVFTSMNSRSPATLFGGQWTQINDRFLYCANYSCSTGGSKKISVSNMPSHNHCFYGDTMRGEAQSIVTWNRKPPCDGVFKYSEHNLCYDYELRNEHEFKLNLKFEATPSGRISYEGSGSDYMPPYITVYAWYRTS